MPRNFRTLVAVDTGGTFTDFYVITPEKAYSHKVLSTPSDPSQAVLQGLRELGLKHFELIHGSTVATNALLERKGARIALITTAGFEDVLEIGRQNRPFLYDLRVRRTAPLAEKAFRWGVSERLNASGEVLENLDLSGFKNILRKIKSRRVESLAVCLLFSYANPRHERKIQSLLKKSWLPVSLSSEICPEYREYERSSTTCLNAYLSPKMELYLRRLGKKIPGLRLMQSNGGSLSAAEAGKEAVRTLLSGPAGGALGALRRAKQAGLTRVLSFDMGGTSTDMSLIDGDLELTTEAEVAGYPVKTPMLHIDTIGAGGGSLAWIDGGGALRVGPESAGADPGPVCYGRGGSHLTLTDAHAYLGRIPPKLFLGGRMALRVDRVRAPLQALARRLRLSPERSAEGMLEVANAHMARALRTLSLQRGHDPRDFTLLCFGGAGGLHACELADLLGMPRVLIPPHAGVLSAYGMAHADWKRNYVQTVLKLNARERLVTLQAMKKRARQDAEREGLPAGRLRWKAQADLRYQGQSYEVTVLHGIHAAERFEAAHQRLYGYRHRGKKIETVQLRLEASFPRRMISPKEDVAEEKSSAETFEQTLHWKGKNYASPVLWRHSLRAQKAFHGPALVVEAGATSFVPPGWKGRADKRGNILLMPEAKR